MLSVEPVAVLRRTRGLSGPSGCICDTVRDGLRDAVCRPVRCCLRCSDSGSIFLNTDVAGSRASYDLVVSICSVAEIRAGVVPVSRSNL